eukprot:18954-Prymnesium_polylepis.1
MSAAQHDRVRRALSRCVCHGWCTVRACAAGPPCLGPGHPKAVRVLARARRLSNHVALFTTRICGKRSQAPHSAKFLTLLSPLLHSFPCFHYYIHTSGQQEGAVPHRDRPRHISPGR